MMNVRRTLKLFWKNYDFLIICSFIVFGFTVYHRLDNVNFWAIPRHIPCDSSPYMNNPVRFSGVVDHRADVPNIIHLLRFGPDAQCFTQGHLNSLISILENYVPSKILIHTDNVNSMKNIIDKIFTKNEARNVIDVKFYPQPNHVFGLNFSETFKTKHMVDFTKLKILRRYGGIFMGNEVHIVQDPNKFLQYEMTIVVRSTMDVDEPLELFDDVVIAHKDARFLGTWLKSYHKYDPNAIISHVKKETMRTLLKKNSMYVHILENDLSKKVVLNSEEYKAMLSSRRRYFLNIQSTSEKCLL